MNYVTIRRNATKKIEALLSQAVAIEGSYYDDMDGTVYYSKTPAEILADLQEYTRIYARTDEAGKVLDVHFSRYSGNGITAWLDVEHARRTLYPSAFAKLFPTDPQSVEYFAQQKAEADAKAKAKRDACEQEQRRLEAEPEPLTYAVGDKFIARFASLNKRGTAEEYRAECVKPEREDKRTCANWYDQLCQVQRVLRLNAGEFAHLCNNLMEPRDDLGEGGTNSDAPIEWAERTELWQLSELERQLWIDASYHLVTVVLCDGCRPLVIDAQGYSYARYVGLYPRPVARELPANVVVFPGNRTAH